MSNTVNSLSAGLGKSLVLLEELARGSARVKELVNALGWELPPGVEDIGLAGVSVTRVSKSLQLVLESSQEDSEDELVMAGRVADLGIAMAELVGEIRRLAENLPKQLGQYGDYVSQTSIHEEFPRRLLDFLVTIYLADRHSLAFATLRLLNIVELKRFEADAQKYQVEHVRAIIHYAHVHSMFSDPSRHLQEAYGWGTTKFSDLELLARASDVVQAMGATVRIAAMKPEVEEALVGRAAPEALSNPLPQLIVDLYEDLGAIAGAKVGLWIFGVRPSSEGGIDGGLGAVPLVRGQVEGDVPLYAFEDTVLEFSADAELLKRTALILRPNLPAEVRTASSLADLADGRFALGIRHGRAESEPKTLLSFPGGSRLSVRQVTLMAGMEKGSESSTESFAELGLWGCQFTLSMSEADGFLSRTISREQLDVSFDFRLGWTRSKGVYFHGAGGLEVTIPLGVNLGSIYLESLHLALDTREEGFDVEASTSGSLTLGPLAVTVRGLGLDTTVSFTGGNLGFLGLSPSFKPPSAIGLSVDAQGIKGGGFLEIDPPNYAGVLELSFQDEIEVTAFGLITTKLPDGQEGFSLVISILAEFQPIQLGLGFALTGVGGLIGINRRMEEDALRETVKNHSLDAILFPTSPIRDAVKVIDSIKKILPPQEGMHVFGPMAQLIWGGTVNLIEFQLGIFIEIGGPVRIALIGQAKSELPDKKAPMVVLNMDLLGFIDFGKETVAIDSSLFDSHIQKVKISGQMALRASWGEDADFAMSIGGFHPRFTPPPGFPALQRLALTLGDGNPRIALTAYLAITSNSLQFGARLELWAKKAGFAVTGGLGFDALFIFHPFSFEIEAEAWVDVRRGRIVLLGVALSLTLSGPNPFRAKGYAKIKICWFLKIKVRFDKTFGNKIQQPEPVISPLAVLRHELEKPRNSRFELPEWASAMLVFAEGAEDRLDRAGAWVFSQNAVPLNLPMERFGGGVPPAAERELRVEASLPGGAPLPSEAVEARFAPEQFHDWTVEEKLAAPAFESFDSGLSLGGDLATAPEASHRSMPIEFETMLKESQAYCDSLPEGSPKKVAIRFAGSWVPAPARAKNWSRAGGQAVFAPRRRRKNRSHRNYVRVSEPKFAVAGQEAVNGLFQPAAADSPRKVSYSQAKRSLRRQDDLVLRHAAIVVKAG